MIHVGDHPLHVMARSRLFIASPACSSDHHFRELLPLQTQRLAVDNHTAIAVDNLPAQLCAVRACQEYHTRRDLARLGWPAHGARKLLDGILVHRRRREWCPYRSRSDSVDTNTLVDELIAETAGKGYNGTLRRSVVEQIGPTNVGVDRGVVDNGVAFLHVLEGGLGDVEEGCDQRQCLPQIEREKLKNVRWMLVANVSSHCSSVKSWMS